MEAALLSLPDACANWEEATRGLPGAPWAAGTLPCGSSPATAWRGIQCDNGTVVSLRLAGLGLEGVLPANLADLPDLQALDLRDNAFRGGIPAAWMQPNSFPALLEADLSGNSLAGGHSRARHADHAVAPLPGFCGCSPGHWEPAPEPSLAAPWPRRHAARGAVDASQPDHPRRRLQLLGAPPRRVAVWEPAAARLVRQRADGHAAQLVGREDSPAQPGAALPAGQRAQR